MKDRALSIYKNVHWLSIAEVAREWAPQLDLSVDVVERELRIGLYKLEHDLPLPDPIQQSPDQLDLPSRDALINREFIERFHDKQVWKLPAFWFQKLPIGPSFPGRPSVMSAIVQELQEVAERGGLADSLAEQARRLSAWAAEQFPGQQTPQPKATENGIRPAYNTLKAALSG